MPRRPYLLAGRSTPYPAACFGMTEMNLVDRDELLAADRSQPPLVVVVSVRRSHQRTQVDSRPRP